MSLDDHLSIRRLDRGHLYSLADGPWSSLPRERADQEGRGHLAVRWVGQATAIPTAVETVLTQQLGRFRKLLRFTLTRGEDCAARAPVSDLVAGDSCDLFDVVLHRHAPDFASPRTAVDTDRFGVTRGDAGEQKAGVPSTRAGGQVLALDEHGVDAPPGEVVQETDPRDPAADDENICSVRQAPRVAFGRPRPEGAAQPSWTTRPNNMDVPHGF